jgi:hypothetical protein
MNFARKSAVLGSRRALRAARRTDRIGGRLPKLIDDDHLGEVVLDAACAWKLGSLAFKLLAGASKERDHESLATFLAVTERLQAKIERNSDQWLRSGIRLRPCEACRCFSSDSGSRRYSF